MSRKFPTRLSNHTNNSMYGDFTTRDNPKFRRTYIKNLPQVTKNRHMNSAHRKFRTSGEEYGHFWAADKSSRENDPQESRAGIEYGSPNAARIPYAEDEDDDTIGQKSISKSVRIQNGDEFHNEAQEAAMKNKRNRDRVDNVNIVSPTKTRDRRSPVLPPIVNGNARNLSTTVVPGLTAPMKSRPPNAKTPNSAAVKQAVGSVNGPGLRIGANVIGDLKLPDIKRIDLDLHTHDGSVVTITAVPVYINRTYSKK